MSFPLTVGTSVIARMFGHTVTTRILDTRVVARGRTKYRLEVPPEIVKEIRSEAHPGSHAWESTEAFWSVSEPAPSSTKVHEST